MVEIWDREASGILRKEPLLLRACKACAYGNSMQYEGGAIYQAHFTYLCGIPNQTIYLENPELFLDKLLVCMSLDWENFIRKQQRLDQILLRRLMKPLCKASSKAMSALPSGYQLYAFDEDALMLACLDERTTSNYNAKAEFTNYFYKVDCGYFNDLNENAVIFYVA